MSRKPPWEWTVADLQALVAAGVKEHVALALKPSAALDHGDLHRNELARDVSALANSAGGTLVYGVAATEGHIAVGLDAGFDPAELSRDWIEQTLSSRIQRPIDDLRVHAVDLGAMHPGRVAYVVSVPQSRRAPHQAPDKRFYRRHHAESVPMEEWEVRDIARRHESPDLRVHIALAHGTRAPLAFGPGELYADPFDLSFSLLNEAEEPAHHAVVTLQIDGRLQVVDAGGLTPAPAAALVAGGQQLAVTTLQATWSVPPRIPVFSGALFPLTEPAVRLRAPLARDAIYVLGWDVKGPRMPARAAFTYLHVGAQAAELRGESLTADDIGDDGRLPWRR